MVNFQKIVFVVKSIVVAVVICTLIPVVAFYNTTETKSAYVMILFVTLWVTEVIPMPVTSLIPVILLPTLDIMSTVEVCSYYLNDIGMLLLSGWIMAAAFDECGLSKRIANNVIKFSSSSPLKLIMGYTVITSLMTMWFSNVVVTSMMVTIAKTQLKDFELNVSEEDLIKDIPTVSVNCSDKNLKRRTSKHERPQNLNLLFKAMLMGVAYGANIGGTATPIGTIANIILLRVVESKFPLIKNLTFLNFTIYGVVGMFFDLIVAVTVLWCFFIKFRPGRFSHYLKTDMNNYKSKPFTYKEWVVMFIAVLTVSLFFFKSSSFVDGWETSLGNDVKITEATPLVLGAFLLFVLPANPRKIFGDRLYKWKEMQGHLPSGIIVLVGGILTLSGIMEKTGITYFMESIFEAARYHNPVVILVVMCVACTFLTEVVSTLLVVLIFLPMVGDIAVNANVHPLYLMLPAALVSSYAFMLPVATLPNTIVAQEGEMEIYEMIIPGILLNCMCLMIQFGLVHTLGYAIFGFDEVPDWMLKGNTTNTTLL